MSFFIENILVVFVVVDGIGCVVFVFILEGMVLFIVGGGKLV